MRKGITKPLKKAFTAKMKTELPQFIVSIGKDTPNGCILFQWDQEGAATAFILLQPHQYRDSFFVEIAISPDGQWPAFIFQNGPDNIGSDGRIRIRLSSFWKTTGLDSGWPLDPFAKIGIDAFGQEPSPIETVLKEIPDTVNNAILALKQWALPYFERHAKRQ